MSLLTELLDRPIAFHRIYASLTGGDINAALLLSQAVYWQRVVEKGNSGKMIDGKKYFYKVQAEWCEETAISKKQQLIARRKLKKFDFWKEEQKGIPRKLFYRISLSKLEKAIQELLKKEGKKEEKKADIAEKSEQNQQSSPKGDTRVAQKDNLLQRIPRRLLEKLPPPPLLPPHEPEEAAGGGGLEKKYLDFVRSEAENNPNIKNLVAYMIGIKRRIKEQGGLSDDDLKQLQGTEIIHKKPILKPVKTNYEAAFPHLFPSKNKEASCSRFQ